MFTGQLEVRKDLFGHKCKCLQEEKVCTGATAHTTKKQHAVGRAFSPAMFCSFSPLSCRKFASMLRHHKTRTPLNDFGRKSSKGEARLELKSKLQSSEFSDFRIHYSGGGWGGHCCGRVAES